MAISNLKTKSPFLGADTDKVFNKTVKECDRSTTVKTVQTTFSSLEFVLWVWLMPRWGSWQVDAVPADLPWQEQNPPTKLAWVWSLVSFTECPVKTNHLWKKGARRDSVSNIVRKRYKLWIWPRSRSAALQPIGLAKEMAAKNALASFFCLVLQLGKMQCIGIWTSPCWLGF